MKPQIVVTVSSPGKPILAQHRWGYGTLDLEFKNRDKMEKYAKEVKAILVERRELSCNVSALEMMVDALQEQTTSDEVADRIEEFLKERKQ